MIAAFRRARERLDLRPLAIHVNYLINLASIDPVIREKSITAFRGELERAEAIGAEYLVTHPGSYRGPAAGAGHCGIRAGIGGSRGQRRRTERHGVAGEHSRQRRAYWLPVGRTADDSRARGARDGP